jgi:hypothetical protein
MHNLDSLAETVLKEQYVLLGPKSRKKQKIYYRWDKGHTLKEIKWVELQEQLYVNKIKLNESQNSRLTSVFISSIICINCRFSMDIYESHCISDELCHSFQ